MDFKFVIQENISNWYIDYNGDCVIIVKNFKDALKFHTKEAAIDFCKLHLLPLKDYTLFELKTTISLIHWSD